MNQLDVSQKMVFPANILLSTFTKDLIKRLSEP